MKKKFIKKYMLMAREIAIANDACYSRKVGVIVIDPSTNGIVGAGYNGPPENTPHCDTLDFLNNFFLPQLTEKERKALLSVTEERFKVSLKGNYKKALRLWDSKNVCPRNILGYNCGKRPQLCSCQHAERNALNKLPIPAKGLVMFCWCGVPCIQCTGSMINAGIKEVHCTKEKKDYQPVSRWLFKCSKTKLIEHDIKKFNDGV